MKSAKDILNGPRRPVTSVVAPYIRADGITLLVGPEGGGKSTLLASIAAAVASGSIQPWMNQVRRGPVLWLTGEEDEAIVAKGLKHAGADDQALSDLHIETVSEPNIPALAELIDEAQPVLVIADPVDVLAPPAQSPRKNLEPLLRMIRAQGIGVVGVLHTLHGARPGKKLAKGAGDWTRLARSILYYGPDPRRDAIDPDHQTAILYHLKSNRGGDRGEAQQFNQTGWLGMVPGLDIDELFERPKPRPMAARPLERALNLLARLLESGPCLASMCLAQARTEGLSRATLYRARDALGVVSVRLGPPGATETYWTLPGYDAQPKPDPGDGGSSEERVDQESDRYPDPADLKHLPRDLQREAILAAFELESCATPEAIKLRWRELLAQHHPDKGGSTKLAARVNALYDMLREAMATGAAV